MDQITPSPHTGLEIASRITRVIFFGIGGLLLWGLNIGGAYAVYRLWTVDKSGLYWQSDVSTNLTICFAILIGIVLVRGVQLSVSWAVLLPLNARILGVDLRDPQVRSDLRTDSAFRLGFEAFGLVVCLAVPLAIAHFRFSHFAG